MTWNRPRKYGCKWDRVVDMQRIRILLDIIGRNRLLGMVVARLLETSGALSPLYDIYTDITTGAKSQKPRR